MLRIRLKDDATALAKEKSHAHVEPRHVWLAVARRFKDRPEVQPLLAKARSALLPQGVSVVVPVTTPEAEALLATFKSDSDAIAALLAAFNSTVTPEHSVSPTSTASMGAEVMTKSASAPHSTPASTPSREDTATILSELESLVGLDAVKRQVKRLIAVVQANEERQRSGLMPINPGLHLVFSGPPGTGKTTVARLIARLYAATGALPSKNFTEATRADLVAGYVGQTAIKTADIIKRTSPGVLFIDEAYSLTSQHDSDFGAEAVATLVKAMEDDRQHFAVIVAGYETKMAEFIQSNPGLKSRFTSTITFSDYSPQELTRIFEGLAKSAGIRLADGVLERAERIFARAMVQEDFGNARFARSLFENGYARMSARAAEDGRVELTELLEIALDDVNWDERLGRQKTTRIGFARED